MLREGISEHTIHVTGNTVIDTLNTIISRPAPLSFQTILTNIPDDKRLILVTAHRRENFGQPLQRIIAALLQLAKREDIHIVYPVHPNPNINKPINELLLNQKNISVSLASKILSLEGTVMVFFGEDFITVKKEKNSAWENLKHGIISEINDYYSKGNTAVLKKDSHQSDVKKYQTGQSSEIINKINEVLNSKIRPAVARDGGDI